MASKDVTTKDLARTITEQGKKTDGRFDALARTITEQGKKTGGRFDALARMITEQGQRTDALVHETDERFDAFARTVADGYSSMQRKIEALGKDVEDVKGNLGRVEKKIDDMSLQLAKEQDFTSDSFDNHETRIRRTEDALGLPPIIIKTKDVK